MKKIFVFIKALKVKIKSVKNKNWQKVIKYQKKTKTRKPLGFKYFDFRHHCRAPFNFKYKNNSDLLF